jgi:hypothetical protein
LSFSQAVRWASPTCSCENINDYDRTRRRFSNELPIPLLPGCQSARMEWWYSSGGAQSHNSSVALRANRLSGIGISAIISGTANLIVKSAVTLVLINVSTPGG